MSRIRSEPETQLAGWREPGERIRQALARDELILYCQPITSLGGGDEFPVILTHTAGREQAEVVARKVLAAFATPFHLASRKQSVDIGTSIGIALYPADAQDADTLVSVADAAMYRAKQRTVEVVRE